MLTNQPVFLFVDIVLFVIALGLLVPIAVLFVECSAALLPGRPFSGVKSASRPRIAVLVPAHNEAQGISATLETILPQLTERDRLVVIADNCTDETAEVAKRCFELESDAQSANSVSGKLDASVVERQDTDRRGKGYALDYGLRYIEDNPPDVVVMVDADCLVHPGTIERIAGLAASSSRPVQATYLMERPANPEPKDAISALAVLVKNLVRPSGLARLGLPCLLTGTGMAFPWSAIASSPLASGNIVEDMQLGIDLAIAGQALLFCQEARVTARLPQQQQAAKSQRMRWEHGHLQTLFTQVPRLLKAAVHQRRFDLLAMALDLGVPPLALTVLVWCVALVVCAFAAMQLGASWIPLILLAIEGLLIFLAIVGAWAKFGRDDLPVLTLLTVPFYVLWKIPLYLRFLVRPQTKWIRTERDSVSISEP